MPMPVKRNPWDKWFFDDYAKDPGLKASSLAAQGLWKRMLCLADVCEPRGLLAINGRPLETAEIAAMCSVPSTEIGGVQALIDELERNKVFSRDRRQIIYSRRMVRNTKRSETNYRNGIKGGHQMAHQIGTETRTISDKPDLEPGVSQGSGNGIVDSPPRESGRVYQKPEAKKEEKKESLAPNGATLFALEPVHPVCDWPKNYRELFWERYPRKIGKTAAMRALDRVRRLGDPPLWGKLMEGLAAYIGHARTVEMRFVKHPATWLNQGCWDDVPEHHGGGNGGGSHPIAAAAERAIAGNIKFSPRPAGLQGRVRNEGGATVVRLLPKS